MNRYVGTAANRPTNPPIGFSYFDTDRNAVYVYTGSGWVSDGMSWRGLWVPGTDYEPSEVVRDGLWTMVANKPTDERPAPQQQGEPAWALPDAPAWQNEQASVSELVVGARVTAEMDGWLRALRVWIASTDPAMEYTATFILDPLGTPSTSSTRVVNAATGWVIVSADLVLIPAGTVFDVVLYSRNRASSASTVANYAYAKPNNPRDPTSGEIVHANKEADTLRVHHVDEDATDRRNMLIRLDPGDTVRVGDITWVIQSNTTLATHSEFVVEPAVQSGLSGVNAFTFTEYSPQPVDFVKMDDHWGANPNIVGLYSEDGYANVVEDEHAYGVDVQSQPATIPADWDLVAFSG